MEQETKSRFVKHSGSSKRKDGSLYTYYYCHRGGDYVPKSKNGMCRKTAGTNKIQANCPASIRTTENSDGKVTVCFVSTHVGHSCDITRMNLTVSERERLAEQIRMKVPLEDILQGIRNTVGEDNLQRIHLTTKRDLKRLILQYGLDSDIPDIDEDDEAVGKWVKFMKENGNIIRFYKPRGIHFPDLEENDFCLIFANEEQLNALRKFGNNILCVDVVHGHSGYDYQFFTILVFDEERNGFPCAFMFSNRSDSSILDLFFKTVVENVGCSLSPKYFISNMDEIFFDVWTSRFPKKDIQQLYAAWHVDKVWEQYLSKIKSEEKKVEVYKKMKILMMERDETAFLEMSNLLMEEMANNDLTNSFVKYFERFIQESSKWAFCYRLEVGYNTDIIFEIFHKNFKHIYQAGKKSKKLIKSIHALQKFLRDRVFQRLDQHCKSNISKKLVCVRKRHQSSLELSLDTVYTLGEDGWAVFFGTDTYNVSLCKKDCSCNLKCEECAVCLHTFSCTCTDSAVLGNMCKHIHLVCRAISVQVLEIYQQFPDEQISDNESTEKEDVIVIQLTPNSEEEDIEQGKQVIILEIANLINAEVKSEKGLETLKQLINPLKDAIRDAEEINDNSSFVIVEEEINELPYKKIRIQNDTKSNQWVDKNLNISNSECFQQISFNEPNETVASWIVIKDNYSGNGVY
ncbi:uncharacterized protein GBIM_07364 [Gryllus bimaculatus]|nr:uncharacterized protein GBIM_07364 [Gryllus bimaculatus]